MLIDREVDKRVGIWMHRLLEVDGGIDEGIDTWKTKQADDLMY